MDLGETLDPSERERRDDDLAFRSSDAATHDPDLDSVSRSVSRGDLDHTYVGGEAPSEDRESDRFALAEGAHVGRYRIETELARGGMGAVYRAADPHLQRSVALKVLHAEDPSALALERFRLEALASARLEHPNIVRVYDVGVDGERPYLVMELIGGESLSQRLRRSGPFSPSAVAALGRTLAEALAYAHEREILHRDLTPRNVLIDARDHVWITDFGLARLLNPSHGDFDGRLTCAGQVLGTPAYMSPEQALGSREGDAPTDVYGLGATLYALLSGHPPFAAPHREPLLDDVVKRPPRALPPSVPPPLRRVIERCLAKAPEDRYPSARALSAALSACAEELRERPPQPALLTPLPALSPAEGRPASGSRPLSPLDLALLTLLVLAALLGAIVVGRRLAG